MAGVAAGVLGAEAGEVQEAGGRAPPPLRVQAQPRPRHRGQRGAVPGPEHVPGRRGGVGQSAGVTLVIIFIECVICQNNKINFILFLYIFVTKKSLKN